MAKRAILPGAGRRIHSIDAYRGLAILLMVLGNFAAPLHWVPDWLKHAPDPGLTIADVVAPAFVFSIALTAGLSWKRRRQTVGTRQAAAHMALRCLSLIGIGAIITAGQAMVPDPDKILSWGVLQALGAAGLILLPALLLPPWLRLAAGLGLLTVYQLVLDRFYLAIVLKSAHNGLFGSLSWAAFLLIASGLADHIHQTETARNKNLLLILLGSSALAAGLVLGQWIPISKLRASASYMLVCLGICLLTFLVFQLLFTRWPDLAGWMRRVGRNPLLLYLVHLIGLGLLRLPADDRWTSGADIWLSLVQGSLLLAAILLLSVLFERKGIMIRL